jgi:SAM-dependent methyltransferase
MYAHVATLPARAFSDGLAAAWGAYNTNEEAIGAGWLPWEEAIAGELLTPSTRVLLIGSGAGRDLVPMARSACRVTAVEPLAHLNALASRALERHGVRARIETISIEEYVPREEFDVIWFSDRTYSYIPGRARRVALLRRLLMHLSPAGTLVISCAVGAGPQNRLAPFARLVGRLFGSDWRVDERDVIARVGPGPAYAYMHAFAPGEAELEAAAAGLQTTATEHPGVFTASR